MSIDPIERRDHDGRGKAHPKFLKMERNSGNVELRPDAARGGEGSPGGAQELAALYRFTDRLFRAETQQDIQEAALDAIVEAMGCARASILLFDGEGVMRFVAWRGLSDGYRKAVDGHSPWKAGARDAAPIVISDIDQSTESEAIKAVIRAEDIRSLAFIPLMVGGGVAGKFMVYYETPREFSDHDIELAVTIARQLGFSLERLNAEASLRRERELLQAIFDRIPVMLKIYEPDRTALRVNREFSRILGWSEEEAARVDLMAELFPDPVLREEVREFMTACPEGWMDMPMRTHDGASVETSWANIRLSDGSLVGIGLDITERKQALERQQLLLKEMDHRIRNLFTLASGMVAMSARGARDPASLASAVRDRLAALARAHALTLAGPPGEEVSRAASLHELIGAILSPYEQAGTGRIRVEGDDVVLSGEAVTALALLLHEFATNAAKYGALSTDSGGIEIRTDRRDGRLDLTWRERGRRPQNPSDMVEGFGTRLAKATAGQLGGALTREWLDDGLVIRLTAAATRLGGVPSAARGQSAA